MTGEPDRWSLRIAAAARGRLREAATRVDGLARLARELSPERVLQRGFSITRDAQERVIRQAAAVPPGALLVTQLAEGRLRSIVSEEKEPHP